MKLRPLMLVGTGSDVGKSVLTAAFCRIFVQDGYVPAPFKAQNMSLNSYATPQGLEIGRAQAVQAEACLIPCSVEMNPVLLKPTGDVNSQVVLHGKPIGTQSAKQFFADTDRDQLFGEAMKAWHALDEKFNPIVMEGAGSISEMNLWDKDITNMRVAEYTKASTILVADIDKGGVFASAYGSIKLLPESQRKCIDGILINKFRGDMSLFEDGKKILEKITGVPVLGVIPFFRDIHIEQEDSVVLDQASRSAKQGVINIGVPLLKHMSNFTDFDALAQQQGVHVFYTVDPEQLLHADIIVIPGSKNTISDLLHLRETGLEQSILQFSQWHKPVVGICGGYQMMGESISDPHGVEGEIKFIDGLGILPVETVLTEKKTTRQVRFKSTTGLKGEGYEIHMGETILKGAEPFAELKPIGSQSVSGGQVVPNSASDATKFEGCFLSESCWGTYIHGVLDNPMVIEDLINQVSPGFKIQVDYRSFKSGEFDRLADLIRQNCDLERIYQNMQLK